MLIPETMMALKYLRNTWYCAAESEEVSRQPLGRVFLNEPVVLYRREDGTPVALEDTCAHRRAPLHKGTLDGDSIVCPYHGVTFNCQGAAIWAQGAEGVPAGMRVKSYPVADKHGWIWIWMGDPALADESLIFDCSYCADPNWATVRGMMPTKAAAMLTIDNLMDLSHTAFVHAATVGSKDDLNPELIWERLPNNGIKGTRHAHGLTPSDTYRGRGAGDYKLDQTKTMEYHPPYNCNIDVFTMEAGRKMGEGRFNESFLTYNMITPETDKTCFYFWANTRNFKVDDPGFSALNAKFAVKLLGEDKFILEAVQEATDLNPERPEIDLTADAGGIQARRMLKRLIEAEEKTTPPATKVA